MEYVFGGSRLKLYIPRETCLITFLLAGKHFFVWKLTIEFAAKHPFVDSLKLSTSYFGTAC